MTGGRDNALVFVGLEQITDEYLERWLVRTPPFRRERYERYRFRADRVRSLAAFCLLSIAAGRIPSAFSIDKYDKPAFPEGVPHFNMTHTGDCVAAAVSAEPVGIDAEEVRKAPFEVMPRVFTAHEIRQVENADDPDRMFFTFWTLKESYIKRLGLGFSFDLHSVEFTAAPHSVLCSDKEYVFTRLSLPGQQIAVCANRPIEPEAVSLRELTQRWDNLPPE